MDANLKREKPADMLRVEAAYCEDAIVGLRITADNPEDPLLIWADNSFMKGFRVGKEFVANWGKKIEYRDVVIGEPEPAAPAAAITPKPDEWDVRGHLAASLTFWHRLKGEDADELVAALQSWATRTQPAGAWIERWYGSGGKDGYEGWSIVSKEGRGLVAYLGRNVESGAVTEIVMAHNATLASPTAQAAPASTDFTTLDAAMRAIQQAIGLIGEPDSDRLRAVRRVLRGAVIVVEDNAPQPAPTAQAAPTNPHWDYLKRYWQMGFDGVSLDACTGDAPIKAWHEGKAARESMATTPTAHAAPAADPAYSEACSLATALFEKHYRQEPDYASGRVVWSLCDTTAGVISQIDNMVSGLARAPAAGAVAPTEGDVFRALIEFILHADDALAFLRCWNEGNFVTCRIEWPEAPPSLYPDTAPTPAAQADSQPAPIDMVLHCPACGLQHVDAADPPITVLEATLRANPLAMPAPQRWDNPPHRSHLCHGCGHIWRPADVPTNGVAATKTTGQADSPIAARNQGAA